MTKKDSALPGYPMRLLRQRLARRKANLLDPNWTPPGTRCNKRFPDWHPAMTTAEYITQYQNMNGRSVLKPDGNVYPWLTFTHSAGVPTQPEAQS
jgi:hypothetical protein